MAQSHSLINFCLRKEFYLLERQIRRSLAKYESLYLCVNLSCQVLGLLQKVRFAFFITAAKSKTESGGETGNSCNNSNCSKLGIT